MTAWKNLEGKRENKNGENEGQGLSKVCRFEGVNLIHSETEPFTPLRCNQTYTD